MKKETIFDDVNKIYDKIISHRRFLHSNPELSFKEYKTSAYIKDHLNKLQISFEEIGETGVIAQIGSGDSCVALRADIDALPISEETGLDFTSCNPGVMHACGHDMHTAILLGAAEILKANEADLGGIVKLIFQPAEEKLPGGASILIDKGVLENPRPGAIFGQHVYPGAPGGKISLASGPIMASADELYWNIRAVSCHAAQPQLGTDAILASSQLIINLHSLVNKSRNPINPGLISITSVHGGTAPNIFPGEVKLMGTLRSFDNDWRLKFHEIIMNVSKNICEMYGCTCEVDIVKGYPPLINNNQTTDLAKNVAEDVFGMENVLEFEPKMWAEDFAYYTQKIPGTFWFLGVRPEGTDSMPGLHNSTFNPSEDAIRTGTAMLVVSALKYLGSI